MKSGSIGQIYSLDGQLAAAAAPVDVRSESALSGRSQNRRPTHVAVSAADDHVALVISHGIEPEAASSADALLLRLREGDDVVDAMHDAVEDVDALGPAGGLVVAIVRPDVLRATVGGADVGIFIGDALRRLRPVVVGASGVAPRTVSARLSAGSLVAAVGGVTLSDAMTVPSDSGENSEPAAIVQRLSDTVQRPPGVVVVRSRATEQ